MSMKFPSIKQYREVIKEYRKLGLYGEVDVIGFPKGHGSNARVVFLGPEDVVAHGKEHQWTAELKDGYGFYDWVQTHRDALLTWARILKIEYPIDYPFEICGEWMGGNVAKGSSCEDMEKFLLVFRVGYSRLNEHGNWKMQFINDDDFRIEEPAMRMFDVRNMGQYIVTINTDHPELAQNELARITTEVETDCPIAKYLGGASSKGEGVVWWCKANKDRHLVFKVKGKKHSGSKIRELATVNPEQVAGAKAFIDYACTENRMEQAVQETGNIEKANMSAFLKWLHADIVKEESDTLQTNGLNYKDLQQRISDKAIGWYRSQY